MAWWGRRPVTLAAVVLVLGGCGSQGLSPDDVKPRADLRTLATIYRQYAGDHGGKAPKNLEEFQAYTRDYHSVQGSFLGSFDPQTAFVSSRDQQPWEWHFPQAGSKGAPADAPRILIAEKTGVDGKRLVALTNLSVLELDEAEIKQYLPAP